MRWVVSATSRTTSPGIHCAGGWGAPGPVWTGAENLASIGSRSPDRPARSESLYQLSYPGPHTAYTQRPKYAKLLWTQRLFNGGLQHGHHNLRELHTEDGSGFNNS
jgi:hypothetical protein